MHREEESFNDRDRARARLEARMARRNSSVAQASARLDGAPSADGVGRRSRSSRQGSRGSQGSRGLQKPRNPQGPRALQTPAASSANVPNGGRQSSHRSSRNRGQTSATVGLSTYAPPRSSVPIFHSRNIPFKFILVALIAVAVVLFLGIQAYSLIRGSSDSADAASRQNAVVETAEKPEETPMEQIDTEALAYLMGNDLATQMVTLAETNADVRWLAANPDAVAVDGPLAQYKLLKLATVEPAAVSFVRDYPDSYPDDSPEPCDPLSDSVDIPLLMQWDQRWGYTVYSSASFGQAGCCPTSLAMVYQGITRKTDMSPYDMGVLANENGFMTQYDGTDGQFLVTCGQQLGLAASTIPVDSGSLRWALSEGHVVIANVGPGDFTDGGHYIVLTGLASNGEVMVNDPYSVVKSEKTWTVESIIGQTVALYMFAR